MSKLFQYAAFWQPTEQQVKEGQKAKIVIEPKTILASDEKGAMIIAARDIPEEYLDKLDQVQIALRPF